MADEIAITMKVVVKNGYLLDTFNPAKLNVTQTTARQDRHVQVIGTSEEVVTVASDVSTLGYACFQNMDSTNFVTIGPESAGSMVGMIKLKKGELAMLRLKPGITIRAQADTASVPLSVWILCD